MGGRIPSSLRGVGRHRAAMAGWGAAVLNVAWTEGRYARLRCATHPADAAHRRPSLGCAEGGLGAYAAFFFGVISLRLIKASAI
jgi:hypothetical protein